jgi:hypothetical protein
MLFQFGGNGIVPASDLFMANVNLSLADDITEAFKESV